MAERERKPDQIRRMTKRDERTGQRYGVFYVYRADATPLGLGVVRSQLEIHPEYDRDISGQLTGIELQPDGCESRVVRVNHVPAGEHAVKPWAVLGSGGLEYLDPPGCRVVPGDRIRIEVHGDDWTHAEFTIELGPKR